MTNDPELRARLERLQQRRATRAARGSGVPDVPGDARRPAHPAQRDRRLLLAGSTLACAGLVAAMAVWAPDAANTDVTSTSDAATSVAADDSTDGSSTVDMEPPATTTPTEAPEVSATNAAPVTSSDAS